MRNDLSYIAKATGAELGVAIAGLGVGRSGGGGGRTAGGSATS